MKADSAANIFLMTQQTNVLREQPACSGGGLVVGVGGGRIPRRPELDYLVLSIGGSDRGFGEGFEGAGFGDDSLFTFGWD